MLGQWTNTSLMTLDHEGCILLTDGKHIFSATSAAEIYCSHCGYLYANKHCVLCQEEVVAHKITHFALLPPLVEKRCGGCSPSCVKCSIEYYHEEAHHLFYHLPETITDEPVV
jgi:hypothetical protein